MVHINIHENHSFIETSKIIAKPFLVTKKNDSVKFNIPASSANYLETSTNDPRSKNTENKNFFR
jgi:hypothetical protein